MDLQHCKPFSAPPILLLTTNFLLNFVKTYLRSYGYFPGLLAVIRFHTSALTFPMRWFSAI